MEEADEGGRATVFAGVGVTAVGDLVVLEDFPRGNVADEDCLLEGLVVGVGVEGLSFFSGVTGRTLIAPVRFTLRAPR